MLVCTSATCDARRLAVRRMEAEQAGERREFEQELKRQGVPVEERERRLAALKLEHGKRIRAYRRTFTASMQRAGMEP